MEQVINRMYEIEEKAKQILDNTTQQKNKMNDQLQSDLASLQKDIDNDTQNKVALIRSTINLEIEKEQKVLIENCRQELDKLNASYSQNHDRYVDQIFQNILSL